MTSASAPAGRALHGSRRQLQDYVNRFPRSLNAAILRELPAEPRYEHSEIHWISPLESDNWREYRDRGFLSQLGLGDLAPELRDFWPRLGPCWDGLGLLSSDDGHHTEVLMVEAKSHIDEVEGPGCRAGIESLQTIMSAFDETRRWLDADDTPAWLGPLYQQANRLAHLYMLRNRLHIDAWLVQIYFLNDPIGPASRADWLPVIAGVHARLGLPRRPPYTLEAFLPALNPD